MVEGINSFKEKFQDYYDCYTLIGGAACDILMSNAELDFRATKDLDVILIMDDRFKEFAKVFWEYINEGQYQIGWNSTNELHFYRFTNPKSGYPHMIELFSRKPCDFLVANNKIVPIHIDDYVSSLSAILLDDEYYNFMIEGKRIVDGISVLDAEYIIPFKMYAWIDLKAKKNTGIHVDERNIKKHKYDVFRLLQIVDTDKTVVLKGLVKKNAEKFIADKASA